MCRLHYPHIQSVSVTYAAKPPLQSNLQLLLLLIDLIDCEKQGKWFSLDNRGCISLHHSLPFTIHPANGSSGIYHRRRHPQNNGNNGETVIDSNWILLTNPVQEKQKAGAKCHRFMAPPPPPKKTLNTATKDRWTSQRVYQYACSYARKPHFR